MTMRSLIHLVSDGRAAKNDPDLTSIMVRVGIACNALGAQMWFAQHAPPGDREAIRTRNQVWSMTVVTALTYEALRLASNNMRVLRPLAQDGGASQELLNVISKLCSGNHEVSSHLSRARNQLAFHWDPEPIAPVLETVADSDQLKWVEFVDPSVEEVIHPFASHVLALAMLPDAASVVGNESVVGQQVVKSIKELTEATVNIEDFFGAAIRGFVFRINGGKPGTGPTGGEEVTDATAE